MSLRESIRALMQDVSDTRQQINIRSDAMLQELENMSETLGYGTMKNELVDLDEDEEEGQRLPKQGWVVVNECPPKCRGIDHYFSDEDNENGSDWSSDIFEAMVFSTKKAAETKVRMIKKTGLKHFAPSSNVYILYVNRDGGGDLNGKPIPK